jgi:hypothetical protein
MIRVVWDLLKDSRHPVNFYELAKRVLADICAWQRSYEKLTMYPHQIRLEC